MSIIYPILLVIHVIFALALIIVVLLQSAKGEGLAGAFGGGALTGAVFGGRGAATLLSKATSFIAVGFMVTSISLFLTFGLRSSGGPESGVLENLQEGGNQVAPPPATTIPGEMPAEGEIPATDGNESAPLEMFEQDQPAEQQPDGN
jgi:preprotein translocase subunit SecG